MKSLIASALLLLSVSSFAFDAPECKDNKGSILSNSVTELKNVMSSRANRPQVFVTGKITEIGKEDHSGLQHQKFAIKVENIKLQIVTNLEFGRIPLAIGKTISVCGEYIKAQGGMVHWTHFDPHGGHADGFSILDGKIYGDVETPLRNNH